jgi:hypothetical protein
MTPRIIADVSVHEVLRKTAIVVNDLSDKAENVDVVNDIIIDSSSVGLVLKSPDAHYWRITIDNAGVLNSTDLGTVKP